VIAQVSLSMILLTCAGLLVRTFIYSLHVDLGFQRKNLLVADVSPPYEQAQAREFYRQLLERVRALPGVRQVTLARRPPLWSSEGGMAQAVEIPGRQLQPGEAKPLVKFNIVDYNYFHTLGIPFLRGRDFDEHDGPDTPKVIIISEAMARRFWPNEDPLGKFVHASDDPGRVNRQIVGVVGDARISSIQEVPEPYMYLPFAQSNMSVMLLTETAGDPLQLGNQVRAEVEALDSKVPVLSISTLGLVIRSSVYEQQIAATVVGALGAVGLFLAAIGLYGVISYAVVQRTREIGIRMALGAQRQGVLRLVLWQGVSLTAIGIAVGLAVSLAVTRLMSDLLYGVRPRDPVTFAVSSAIVILIAMMASYIPALRAMRVDPVVALRYE